MCFSLRDTKVNAMSERNVMMAHRTVSERGLVVVGF